MQQTLVIVVTKYSITSRIAYELVLRHYMLIPNSNFKLNVLKYL